MAINVHDLSKRVVVGTVYVLITAAATFASWYSTVIVIAFTAALCCYEFLRMAHENGYRPYVAIGTATAALIPLAMGLVATTNHAVAGGLVVALVAGVIMLMRYFAHMEDTIVDVALTLFAYLYTGLMLSSFVLLRGVVDGPEGGVLCILILCSIWANDGFAYLGGSAFGKHKFAPHISPKKTWEGVACGMAASVVLWLTIVLFIPDCGFGWVWAVIAGLLVGFAGIIGDLTESHIKRGFNAKDSGDLMPGHGGLLDRSDSFIFGSVAAYAMVAGAPYVFMFIGFTL
jgi:phosphatidate cytidylyltransferase